VIGKDPWAYLDAVLGLISGGSWDVLFPTHEQAFLFARERARILPGIGLGGADFRSFLQVQGKAALVRTLNAYRYRSALRVWCEPRNSYCANAGFRST